jgi:hypothetical protein
MLQTRRTAERGNPESEEVLTAARSFYASRWCRLTVVVVVVVVGR